MDCGMIYDGCMMLCHLVLAVFSDDEYVGIKKSLGRFMFSLNTVFCSDMQDHGS